MTSNEIFSQSPLYVVLFSTTADVDDPYSSPIIAAPQANDSAITVPHGFDREIAAALPGLWYCIHLPNTFLQLIDIPAAIMKASQALCFDHRILVAPIQIFDQDHIGRWLAQAAPALVVCPDDLVEEAARRSAVLGFALPPTAYSELSNHSLRAHWKAIHARFVPDTAYLGQEPTLTHRLDLAPTDLPRRWLARQMWSSSKSQFVTGNDLNRLFDQTLWGQLVLAAISRLEHENVTPHVAEKKLPRVITEERVRLRVPVTLALPGVAPAYCRVAYNKSSIRDRVQSLTAVDEEDTWSLTMNQRSDALVDEPRSNS